MRTRRGSETGDDVNRVDADLDNFIPENPNQPYDIRELIKTIADGDHFLEVHQQFARNLVVGFIRLNGYSVGVVANQPSFLAGVLDMIRRPAVFHPCSSNDVRRRPPDPIAHLFTQSG